MKILAVLNVPEGDYCKYRHRKNQNEYCSHLHLGDPIAQTMQKVCRLFNMELESGFMSGPKKCQQCKDSEIKE